MPDKNRQSHSHPGFVIEGSWAGRPRLYISHGKRDRILSIEKCGWSIAADMNAHAYRVTLTEFDGSHETETGVRLAICDSLSLGIVVLLKYLAADITNKKIGVRDAICDFIGLGC